MTCPRPSPDEPEEGPVTRRLQELARAARKQSVADHNGDDAGDSHIDLLA